MVVQKLSGVKKAWSVQFHIETVYQNGETETKDRWLTCDLRLIRSASLAGVFPTKNEAEKYAKLYQDAELSAADELGNRCQIHYEFYPNYQS